MSVKISVICPGYKENQYQNNLDKQTMHDVEFLFYDENNNRARNDKLKIAEGKYIFFPDINIRYEQDALETLFEKAEKVQADICICNSEIKKENFPSKETFSCSDISEDVVEYILPTLWNKLYRRDFIEKYDIHFQPCEREDELYFSYMAMACAGRITIVSDSLAFKMEEHENSLFEKNGCIKILTALKSELIKRGKFKETEKSFVNVALDQCLIALDRQKDFESFRELCLKFKKSLFYELGILGHPGNWFSKKKNFDYMLKIMGSEPEESWMKKSDDKRINTTLVDFSEWKSDKKEKKWDKAKISVIIPVYNVEKYLEEALKSIVEQSLKEIEIICVDDGSTDKSSEILGCYAKMDSRIKVFRKENGGLSSARNLGIQKASGKYIYFFDSDDILERRTLEICFNEAEQHCLDMVLFSAEPFYENSDLQKNININYYKRYADYSGIMSGKDFFIKAVLAAEFKPSVCLYLINREVIEKGEITFYEGIIQEDNLFTIEALIFARSVKYINSNFYKRRVRENSVMTGRKMIQHAYSSYIVMRELSSFMEQKDFQRESELYSALLTQMLRSRNYICAQLSAMDLKELREEAEKLPYGIPFYFYACDAAGQRRALTWTKNAWDNEKTLRYKKEFDLQVTKEQGQNLKNENSNLKKRIDDLEVNKNNLEKCKADLEKKNVDLERMIYRLKEKNAELLASWSYKLGHIILFIPGKIKRFIERKRK